MINIDNLLAEARLQRMGQLRIDTLCSIKKEFIDYKTSAERHSIEPLTEAEQIKVIKKMIKNHEKSIAEFTEGNRMDLVEKEMAELAIIKEFEPEDAGVPLAEINKAIEEFKLTTELSPKTKGMCIGFVKSHVPGADGATVAKIVNEKLSNL